MHAGDTGVIPNWLDYVSILGHMFLSVEKEYIGAFIIHWSNM